MKKEYHVTVSNEESYMLTIEFGNGQPGHSAFRNFNGNYITGTVSDVLLGKGQDVKTKSLLIVSVVTDTNPSTNEVVATYKLNDQVLEEPISKEVDQNGTLIIETIIEFS